MNDLVGTWVNWIVIASTFILLGVIIASWLASYRAPKATANASGDWFFRLPVWAQIGGGFVACLVFGFLGGLLWIPLPLDVSPMAAALLRIVGFGFFVAGWFLALWARWTLGAMYGVSTSFTAPIQTEHRLIQSGPYALIRHPMYSGYWLLLVGLMLLYRTWTPLLFLVISILSFYRRALREESALAERFGEEWRAYAMRTRFLIPFLY